MSSLWPRSSTDSWFRVGRIEVTTVVFVMILAVASWIAWAVYPPLPGALALYPAALADGQLWRLATWPLADTPSFWGVMNLAMFWFFGTELESQIGRRPMAWFLGGVWLSLTASALVIGLLAPGSVLLASLGLIELIVLGVWIAEYPNRPFFFGIPAWIVGVVIFALQVLLLIAGRGWGNLLTLLLGIIFSAMAARSVGLLGSYPWIPGARQQRRRPRTPQVPTMSRSEARNSARHAADRRRLDDLLDRINETGIGSLTEAERKELVTLRNRLRGDA